MNRKSPHFTVARLLILAGAGVLCSLAFAGPLNPPAGPVTPTYKTLTEVEPRIAINATNTPGNAVSTFRITQGGSYYLTSNITALADHSGILIEASNVTIDLGGFRIQGLAGSLSGVRAQGNRSAITIRNGTITFTGESGIELSSGGTVTGAIVENIQTNYCAGSGFRIGNDAIVRNCTAYNNNDTGFEGGQGTHFENCTARENSNGFSVGQFGRATDCVADTNTIAGFNVSNGSNVTGCTATANGYNGFYGGYASLFRDCTAADNGTNGFYMQEAATVSRCLARRNGLHGITLGIGCTLVESSASYNGVDGSNGAGIHVSGSDNRIEFNTSNGNDIGVWINGSDNLIFRNSCAANTTNWDIDAGNVYGPVIDRTGAAGGSFTGNVSVSDTITTAHPLANFSH
jgi:hypothetical protein